MAKKFRKIITLVLVAAMALSLCGISALAWPGGNPQPQLPADVVTITVTDGSSPIAGARVTLSSPDVTETYFGDTDANGQISFTEKVVGYRSWGFNQSTLTTNYSITVTKDGYEVGSGFVDVVDDVGGQDYDAWGSGAATVQLTPITYTITASATNGTITPPGDATVAYGGDQEFTYAADSGYELSSVVIDCTTDVTATNPGSYTFTNVTENHTIAVTYQEQEQEPDPDPVDEVIITVEDTEGNPIEGAHVTLTGPTSPAPEGDTDANGQITFTDSVVGYSSGSNTSEYSIAVTKAGYVDGSGTVTVTDDWFVNGQWSYGDADVFGHGNATVVLTAETPPEPETETVQFYIERLGQIRDTTSGGVAGRPVEDFSNCILSQETTVTLYQIAGDSTTGASIPDYEIRTLLPGQYPSDETVFNFLKAESDSAKKPTTTLDGVAIDYVNLDTAHYTVQWYVLKDQGVWHVDGVIVTKTQQPETTNFTVYKEWSDSETVTHNYTTEKVWVQLYADGVEVPDSDSSIDGLVSLNDSGRYYWWDLPMYNDDAEIEYTVVETNVPANYTASYNYLDSSSEGFNQYEADNVCIITNTYTPYNPPVGSSYYTLTVNWVDGEGSPLADPETESVLAYSGYNAANVEGGSDRAFEGYTYSALAEGSDDASGTMNGNKTVTFVYAAEEDIPEETPPLNPEPTEEVPDDDVPLDSSPKTGDNTQIALLWLLFFASFSGLVVMAITAPKKRTEKH